jgi:hypothetical protein
MRSTHTARGRVTAAAFALALSALSMPVSHASQTSADRLKFDTDGTVLIIWSIKPDRVDAVLGAWARIREALAKSARGDYKEFAATIGPIARFQTDTTPAAGPVELVMKVTKPSRTYSYNPGKIVYELLFLQQELPRAEADGLMSKLQNCCVEIQTYVRTF